MPLALGAQSFNLWTTRRVPGFSGDLGMAATLNPLTANIHAGQLLQKCHFLNMRSGGLKALPPTGSGQSRPGPGGWVEL